MQRNEMMGIRPYVLCIVGGTSSGKTTITEEMKKKVNKPITHFGLDNFYIGISEEINPDDYDFDHPSSLDWDYIVKCATELVKKGRTEVPIYDFTTHSRKPGEFEILEANEIIVFEGIMFLPYICGMMLDR